MADQHQRAFENSLYTARRWLPLRQDNAKRLFKRSWFDGSPTLCDEGERAR